MKVITTFATSRVEKARLKKLAKLATRSSGSRVSVGSLIREATATLVASRGSARRKKN